MTMIYTYVVTQREYNHNYAREKGMHKKLLLDIYGTEDRAYSEENWYFLDPNHVSTNLAERVLSANIAADYLEDEDGYGLPDEEFDPFLQVIDWEYEDCEIYRTYECILKTTLEPKEFRETLYPRIIASTYGLLAGLYNRTGVEDVVIELEGNLSDYEYDFEKVSDTPVVIGEKAYFQMKCKKSGKEMLKEIEIMK